MVLMNALFTFQRIAESLFTDIALVLVQINNMIIDYKGIKEQTIHLIVVRHRVVDSIVEIELNKGVFAALRVEGSEYIVSNHGVETGPEKVKYI